ncbi:NADP-dependent 3-hydroxy acid dehydrogenase YdfG [Agromyces sp. CF514]|uniref:SDR family NAD(P)-dependent oxidoreductase n=1 Tax=Agromyces sp. CF514 TaxID=1881031 RepID=UPI0008ED7890|nr:SDR family NAD(P)-dependent oxidoreductase [Agromyces sp. CF514]SFR74676.1 NADP-dependent 3-hydroxy acid dehydrogenase YdfG [Agromyces sp. CF514]
MTGARLDRPSADGLPDLRDARGIVTGASSGIGLEIARGLAGAGADLVVPVRDAGRGERAIASIRSTDPQARLDPERVDLARLDSVRALVERLLDDGRPIDLLVLNAGIVLLGDRERHMSADGYELHLHTNFLGHAVLVLGILPLLLAAPEPRVAVQVSLAAASAKLDLDDEFVTGSYTPLRAYGSSKLALGLFGLELGRRHSADGLRVALCHPGIVPDTGIAPALREKSSPFGRALSRSLGNTPAEAAQPAVAALTTDVAPGRFIAPSGPFQLSGPAEPRKLFRTLRDETAAARVWRFAERIAHAG